MACGSECNQEVGDALHVVETHLAQNNQATTGDPVNVVTGAFLHSEQDVAISCQRLVLELVRHYNNQRHDVAADPLLQPFGPGWTHSLGMRIMSSANDTVRYRDDRGSELVFVRSPGTEVWMPPPGSLGLSLQVSADRRVRLRQLSGFTAEFTPEGRLSSLSQPGPRIDSQIVLSYDAQGRLSLAAGADGRGLEFIYHPRSHVIAEVHDYSGRKWRYAYNDYLDLVEVCDPAGRCRRYAYSRWTGRVASGRKTTAERTISALTTIFGLTWKDDAAQAQAIVKNSYTTEQRVYLQKDALGNETRFEYNPFTQTTVVTNALGDSTAYCFDNAGCTTKVRKPSGATTEYVFDDQRNLLAEIDPMGHRTEYVTFTDPEKLNAQFAYGRRAIGNRAAYLAFKSADLIEAYDADGNRPLVREATGAVTRFRGYTAFGQATEVEAADGAVIETHYEQRSGLPLKRTIKGPMQNTGPKSIETWQYDDIGCCTEHRKWAEEPNGSLTGAIHVETFAFDQMSQLRERRSWMESDPTRPPFASEVHYEWDALGRLVTETHVRRASSDAPAEFRISRYGYDEAGLLRWQSLPDGSAAVYEYDVEGRLTERFTAPPPADLSVMPHVAPEHRVGRERWSYDAAGNERRFIDPTGAVTIRDWDGCGRCLRITAPSRQETRFIYDRDGNLVKQETDAGHENHITYDASGRWIQRSDNLGYLLKVKRDCLGRVTDISQSADSESWNQHYEYQANGKMLGIQFADGAVESFRYDAYGNRCERRRGWSGKEPDSVEQYTFDAHGRIQTVFVGKYGQRTAKFGYEYNDSSGEVRCIDAIGNVAVSRYDNAGFLVERIDAEGRRLRFSHDTSGRLIRRWSEDGSVDATYAYSQEGRMEEATEHGVGYQWVYDSAGRVVEHRQNIRGQQRVMFYRHDDAGRVIEKRCDDAWWVRLKYGSSCLPSSLSLPGKSVDLTYDPAGRLTGEWWDGGGSNTYAYAPTGALTQLRCLDQGGNLRFEQVLELDHRQRPLTERRRLGHRELALFYRYDALNRLTEQTISEQGHSTLVHRYEYDEHQNRVREQLPDSTTRSFACDEADRLLSTDQPSGPMSRTYDRCGLLTHDGLRPYTYDAAHRLRSVGRSSTDGSVAFEYAATGELACCVRGEALERTFYDGTLAVLSETSHERRTQFWGIRPDCLIAAQQTELAPSRIFTDLWGSVLGGEPDSAMREYGPFGESEAELGGIAFGFSSKLYEPCSGLYYNRARFYDPATGRFIQPDPKGMIDGPNLYVFGLNNPVHYGDPEGTEARHHSHGRIAAITPALAFFPGQRVGRTDIVGPRLFESGIHAEHFDRNFQLIGRSYIVGPRWFENNPRVEHYDANWKLVAQTYLEGPTWWESLTSFRPQSHFQHYSADWKPIGKTYTEGPTLWESLTSFNPSAHFQHYDEQWRSTGRTYMEGPTLWESLTSFNPQPHFQRYAR
jgi:RHS repeat-associated protein